ncbi:Permease of the major facilitator superfamily [Ceraceosorus bombacis]|uniref:Permease of the major facilitator superfamily n=1 Tax=Ceraceosorus bombacis TaxID=401625 RepID=A0A0N7LAJ9_9BASI|nr:Permease of the major facilitator superfamily [Ceraceosorus bombacis]
MSVPHLSHRHVGDESRLEGSASDVKKDGLGHQTSSAVDEQDQGSGSSPKSDELTARGDTTSASELAAQLGVDERKLMRKVDLHLIPFLSLLYLFSFLDRSAIGNAKLYGLEDDLQMQDTDFSIAAAIFFIPYALFEVPSNILLKAFRPSIWFPIITMLVGCAMLSQGVVSSYGGLLAARFCLGVVEAGLFPGVNLLLSGWYKRSEFGLRAALFFSAATISGAFGGLLSAAIHNMDGIGGYAGWRWIFIIIGLATFVIGVLSFWLVHDFPETARFITEGERRVIIKRLQCDQQLSASGERFTWASVGKGFVDIKTWVGALAYMGCDGPLYAFSTFTPTIIRELGYQATRANLLSVPIYVIGCLVTILVGFVADRRGNRAMLNVLILGIGIAAYIVLAASRLTGLSYAFIYLAAIGIYPAIPNTISLTISSVEGSFKRSVVSAVVISWGNLNGAATTNVYRAQDQPWYPLGHGLIVMYIVIGMLSNLTYVYLVKRENAARERGANDENILDDPSPQGVERAQQIRTEEIAKATGWRKIKMMFHEAPGGTYATREEAARLKGDAWSGFRYSY